MSMGNVSQWFNIISVTFLTTVFFCALKKEMLPRQKCSSSISKHALRDLRYVGSYNDKLRVSVKYWIYAIAVKAYYLDKVEELFQIVQKWNDEHNFDATGFISTGIDSAYTTFRDVVQCARDNNEEPKFKTAHDYDYHNYPLSFLYNDYICPDILLGYIDELLEVSI